MTITFKDQELNFEFGLYFLGKAQTALGYSDFNELLQNIKSRADIVDLMYISAKTSAYLDEKTFNISKREWITSFESNEIGVENIELWEGKFVESINNEFLPKTENDSDTSKKIEWGTDVISVALGELGCPSLDYVYRMTWAEFQLRLISFNRQQKNEFDNVRLMCWYSFTSNRGQKELKGLTFNRFMSSERKASKPSERALKAFNKAMNEYKEIKKRKDG